MKRLFQGDWKWWLAVIVFSETANAGLISGSGDPLSHSALLGGDQEGFDNVASQDVSRITLGGVTFSGVGGALKIGSDRNGKSKNSGKLSLNGFD